MVHDVLLKDGSSTKAACGSDVIPVATPIVAASGSKARDGGFMVCGSMAGVVEGWGACGSRLSKSMNVKCCHHVYGTLMQCLLSWRTLVQAQQGQVKMQFLPSSPSRIE